ncbi:glycosidase crf1 [Neofusicoccum parvum]|uniref:Glycosidase crf1 n=1 Tax=Neofusicoccum parvum TaxID=310453 RepID=A0ACB5RXG2_9PEZI|nr:glycosidase crf1 [Neofusicoccum parvum]GME53926.1 glycosidase crf1 [Neofusicoccum parvum]
MRSQSTYAGAAIALLSAAVPLASAQLYSDCNPTKNSTCPPNVGLANYTFESDFTTGDNSSWEGAAYTVINYGDNGAEFTINKDTDAPTMHTEFYSFFGYFEVEMKAAPGTGVVSSIVLESDDLDEVDWECLGGNTTSIQSNYFGKGNTTSYDRGAYHEVDTPQDTFHKYAFEWTNASMSWLIDGNVVRTLAYEDALGGKNYPQTPARLSLGVWSAGTEKQDKWTVEWAGGYTDFDDAPFTMYVKSVKIINYNPGMNYNWTDETGSFESIQIINETVAVNSSSTTDSSSSSLGSGVSTNGSSSTGTASSASGTTTAFAQNGSSAASSIADRAWIVTSAISFVSFAIGFSLL